MYGERELERAYLGKRDRDGETERCREKVGEKRRKSQRERELDKESKREGYSHVQSRRGLQHLLGATKRVFFVR